MEDLESMNKLIKVNYYDQETWDEDKPEPGIPIGVHKQFEEKEVIFNELAVDINVKMASVTMTINI
jgi:hypothetical protein